MGATVRGYDEGWRVMGRRTAGRRAGPRRGRTPVAVVAVLCTTGALGVTAAVPGQAAATPSTVGAGHGLGEGARTETVSGSPALGAPLLSSAGDPDPYGFAEDARTVEGADGTTGAVRLEPGGTYRSSIAKDGKLYYRLELDAVSNAYVSVTAVPAPGSEVSAADGIKVSVQEADGSTCSAKAAHIGATQSPHPVAASAFREIGRTEYVCQEAGTYYAVVERSGPPVSASDDWDLELGYTTEPRLRQAGATNAPRTWNSVPPQALQGEPRRRPGGTGFSTAVPLGEGVWRTGLEAGRTLFYKVPLDWGQQLYATAELGSTDSGGRYVGTALSVALYNPVRGFVEDVGTGYGGSRRQAVLPAPAPVAYENRYAISARTSGMRFAGSYYLVLHLGARVAEKSGGAPLDLTLRVGVSGEARGGPAYAGRSVPRDAFEVTPKDRAEAAGAVAGASAGGGADGSGGVSASGDPVMKWVAATGIGSGCALTLTLAGWTAVARRRGSAARAGTARTPGG
ncbi:hypothetical protein [Streptomyces sp. NPDC005907]|uniref:hypothetical protein n=1 Tax=Streptomyces sp. NPDC005907 TaxID=3154571 RepID=UPI0033C603C7